MGKGHRTYLTILEKFFAMTSLVCLSFLITPSAPEAQTFIPPSKVPCSKVVTIDPGHGGYDFGAEGSTGIKEKTVTLEMARQLKKALENDFSVRLTRDGDFSVDNEKRAALSNYYRSDLFVSLHAGSGFDRSYRGVTVYCHSDYYHPEDVPSQKGNAIGEGPPQPRLWYHIQASHLTESKRLAKFVHARLSSDKDVVDQGIHEAPLLVLEGADAPAILVELGYLSQPAEEAKLMDKAYLSELARAISEGIRAYLRQTDGCIPDKGVIEEDI